MTAILVALLALPVGAALVATCATCATERRLSMCRVGAAAAGVCVVLAGVLAVVVVRDGPVTAALGAGRIVGLQADRLAVAMLLLVFGVSAVVQSFAARYLAGDVRAGWFSASAGLLTAASAGLVTAATLLTLAVCWTLAGVALCLLLGTYWVVPAARDGVARTVRAFLIGDAALWVAVTVVTARWGTVRLDSAGAQRLAAHLSGHPVVAGLVGCLVVVAALSRSAQLPLQGWLPATLAAPTPVSALLHAGVVNAGGLLLVRLSPLVRPEPVAMGLVFAAGALTAVYATLIMLTKPDVKGALAHSTMGQMGFMIMTCGLGLYAAAVFHLIAHGLYKATLFLSSGSAIAAHRRHRAAPPLTSISPRRTAAVAAVALLLPGLALLAAVTLLPLPPGPGHASSVALLVFAWASATTATHAWLRRHPSIRGGLGAALTILGAACGYAALVEAAARFLAPALPTAAPVQGAVWMIAILAGVLAGLTLLRHTAVSTSTAPAGLAGRLQSQLYVLVLTAGHVRPRPRPTRLAASSWRSRPRPDLIATGARS